MAGRVKKAAAPKKKANGYKMPAPIPLGEVIDDPIKKKKWRIGPSIGVGGFGEIYSACEHNSSPKKTNSYPYVIKIEPHENGPLFVEKTFYIRNANSNDITQFMKSKKLSKFGMPSYYGNGLHEYNGEKYRYLVLERYGKDLWSIFKESGKSFPPTTVFQIGLQMLDVLEYIHSKGYVHADIKGANILLGLKKGTEDQTYLVDFGLATRVFADREFKPEPKCAHNGTIEYTSRDAHLGVPTMRGDVEILAYNMLQWLVGALPWEKSLKQPKAVQTMKEAFMKSVRTEITNKYPDVPEALIKLFEYINTLKPKANVDFTKCRQILESYLKFEGVAKNSRLVFKANQKPNKSDVDEDDEPIVKVAKKNTKTVKASKKAVESVKENGENQEPAKRGRNKRKSLEPAMVVKVKKTKMAPKATPKTNSTVATQTSFDRLKQVSFDSPIAEIIGEKKGDKVTSPDMFEDSLERKVRPRRKLLNTQEVTVRREVKRKVTRVAKPILNGSA